MTLHRGNGDRPYVLRGSVSFESWSEKGHDMRALSYDPGHRYLVIQGDMAGLTIIRKEGSTEEFFVRWSYALVGGHSHGTVSMRAEDVLRAFDPRDRHHFRHDSAERCYYGIGPRLIIPHPSAAVPGRPPISLYITRRVHNGAGAILAWRPSQHI